MKFLLVLVLLPVALLVALQVAARVYLWSRRGRAAPALQGKLGGVVAGTGRALLYFYSPTCGPCRQMSPTVERLREEDPRVHPVDVSRTPEVALGFGVLGTPSVVLVEDGVIRDVRMGIQSEAALRGLLNAA